MWVCLVLLALETVFISVFGKITQAILKLASLNGRYSSFAAEFPKLEYIHRARNRALSAQKKRIHDKLNEVLIEINCKAFD